MGKSLAMTFIGMAAAALGAVQAGGTNVEVKGPHICCQQCAKVVGDVLKDVSGVTDVKADRKTKTVTFTAKDEKAVRAGFMALVEGGFFGSVTEGGKEINFTMPVIEKGAKADVVTVKEVHVCCGACQKAIINIFKDSKVTFDGQGPQRTVRIAGKDLDRADVMEALHKTGFNGTLEK